jgi:hypothetical protein
MKSAEHIFLGPLVKRGFVHLHKKRFLEKFNTLLWQKKNSKTWQTTITLAQKSQETTITIKCTQFDDEKE